MKTEVVHRAPCTVNPVPSNRAPRTVHRVPFKEKRELELLEKEIPELEAEQSNLEAELSNGTLSPDDLFAKSQRIGRIIEELEMKTMRWIELSEKS